MTQEEKAKRYDKALKQIKECTPNKNGFITIYPQEIFTELKESDDEKIRKSIINLVIKSAQNGGMALHKWESQQMLVWLEKQGEHRPADNRLIPQKGEYYICIKDYYTEDGKTTNTKGEIYKSPCDGYIYDNRSFGLLWTNSCIETYFSPVKDEDWIVCEYDNVIGEPIQYKILKSDKVLQKAIKKSEDNGFVIKLRLWTIQDAKDGDVLLSPSTPEGDKECPFIFKEIDKNGIVRFYVALLQSEKLEIADGITNVMGYANAGYHIPATKEQRDLLFAKMKEAGYEWDVETKELKKIEQRPAELGKNRSKELSLSLQIQTYLNTASDELYAKGKPLYSEERIKDIHKCMLIWQKLHNAYFYQKPAWSEEDERILNDALDMVEWYIGRNVSKCRSVSNWLKSLKDRVQPKQEWNEKNESWFN